MSRTSQLLFDSYSEHLLAGEPLYISCISHFELFVGLEKSLHQYSRQVQLTRLLLTLEVLPFEDQDALEAARIRAELERTKQPIGPYDTLIAGHAIARNLTLITANVREFARVPNLKWQDWTIPSQPNP
ncbi:PilT protein domain protein [Granulicella tundricola MP5ACTX9]|uniref:PilT protein domain protein n=2 Tax=Granulicella TaxID=940557 RepID=E8X3B1_GRATM|nr:PilT protein domain protein [Granulicella tundricola MP5ACTX9]